MIIAALPLPTSKNAIVCQLSIEVSRPLLGLYTQLNFSQDVWLFAVQDLLARIVFVFSFSRFFTTSAMVATIALFVSILDVVKKLRTLV